MSQTPDKLFRYCPRCGAAAFVGIRPDLLVCGDCDLHYHLNAAAASGAILLREDGKVLFTVREKEPAKGFLGLPGGFVDLMETAELGLRRELWEEVGLEVGELRFIASYPNQYEYRDICYRTLDLFFEARVPEGTTGEAREEVAGLLWLDPSGVDLDRLAFPSMKQALKFWMEKRKAEARVF